MGSHGGMVCENRGFIDVDIDTVAGHGCLFSKDLDGKQNPALIQGITRRRAIQLYIKKNQH